MRGWLSGFVLAVVSTAFWPALPPPVSAVVPALGALACLGTRTWAGCVMGGCLLGLTLAIVHGNAQLSQRLAEDCVGKALLVEGAVASLVAVDLLEDGTQRSRFQLDVTAMAPQRCAAPRRLELSVYGPGAFAPGERWRLAVKLKRPWGAANPGGWNAQGWYARRGVDAVGHVPARGERTDLRTGPRAWTGHHGLRAAIAARIAALRLPADSAAVLGAVSIADRSGVDDRLWRTFQYLGLNHLLVVSGLHVSLVAGIGFLLGGVLGRAWPGGRWLPPVCALAPAVVYAALAGFSLPVQRALYMLGAFAVASLVGRRGGAAGNLLLAAAAVLALAPLAPTGSGFWLSFGAVSALLWYAAWQRPVGRLRSALGTQAWMSLVMLPVGAWFFGGGSLVSVLANLLMIPLLGCVVVPLALLASTLFLAGLPGDEYLWRAAAWPLERVLPKAALLVQERGNWLFLPLRAGPLELLLALAGLAVARLPGRPLQRLLPLCLSLPLLLPRAAPLAPVPEVTQVTVLDVGQGTAVVVRAGQRALLYDTGGGRPGGANAARSAVLPYLAAAGVERLDTFIVSHGDTDHSAGVADILAQLPVARLRRGEGVAAIHGGRPCAAGESWRWPGGQQFRFLSPSEERGLSSNNGSCVLQVQVGEHRFLLAGDVERERERELVRYWRDDLASDWLLSPHHGSGPSSSPTLLKVVEPRWAVVSAAYASRFGHPHPRVLARYDAAGIQVLGTAASGALEFTFTPGELPVVSRYRERAARFWM